jgi:soluble cytochrome b562
MGMGMDTSTLEGIKGGLERLRAVAVDVYAQHPASEGEGGDNWKLKDYLAGIDELGTAIDRALTLVPCTRARHEVEKFARNVLAVRLYYGGRLCPRTGRIGRFYKKSGGKNLDWIPTELSRQADRIAAEPLRHIYKRTEGVHVTATQHDREGTKPLNDPVPLQAAPRVSARRPPCMSSDGSPERPQHSASPEQGLGAGVRPLVNR